MNALTGQEVSTHPTAKQTRSATGRAWRRYAGILLGMVAALVALLALVPVVLLPFITAVPLLISLPLLFVGGGFVVLLFIGAAPLWARAGVLAALLGLSVLAVFLSQSYAATPPIRAADGQVLPGSIAALEAVELNGREQWITIRGHDRTRPVLLFLAGGPGGSQLAATRKQLPELEEAFVVVNWDQPGAGKSFAAADLDTITPEQYIADAHALTTYLQERFNQEKIFLVGESWGSLLGVWLVERYPGDYHALAGAAQMVAFLETDLYDYDLAMQIAQEQGDTEKVAALQAQGPPPYYGDGVARKVTEYILYLSTYMNQNPAIHTDYDTFGDIAAPEYGLVDKVNYVLGLLRVMDALWPQLWDVDLRQEAAQLAVPVYFIEGRHDVNAPPELVEDYYQQLDAPHKKLIWFEHSGHSPWVEESDKFVQVMQTILAEQRE